jgi:soluble lytic murein transglycosylase-like protein
MPETANAMAVENPFDPEENILGGTSYLSLLLKRFNNDKTLAIAAYNAGPTNVESYRGVPPFPETHAFVKKVIEYYRAYITGGQ